MYLGERRGGEETVKRGRRLNMHTCQAVLSIKACECWHSYVSVFPSL